MINVCEVDDFWPVTVKHHGMCRLGILPIEKHCGSKVHGIFRSAL